MNKNLKIGIVGLGLIGGSIFKAFCALKCNVFGVSKSVETIEQAKQYSDNVSKSLESLQDCDVIFVCTPMHKTLSILDKLESIVSEKTIVADVASLKRFLCKKKRPYVFIPTHPMAGTEFSGFYNSFESLFIGAKWVLTPLENVSPLDIKNLSEIIEVLGAKPLYSKPAEHDEAVALISHLPMIISQAVFKTAQHNNLALQIASSGFRDMTRLALSNEEMAQDMLKLNSDNIKIALSGFQSSLDELMKDNYRQQITEIKQSRQDMYQNGKNIL